MSWRVARGSGAWPNSVSRTGTKRVGPDCHPAFGNHSRSVAVSFLKAGSSQPSRGVFAAISPKILAERLRRVALEAPFRAWIIAALGSFGFMRPLSQSPLRPSHDRSSSYLRPQPRALETTGDPDHTHSSSSGSITTACARHPESRSGCRLIANRNGRMPRCSGRPNKLARDSSMSRSATRATSLTDARCWLTQSRPSQRVRSY